MAEPGWGGTGAVECRPLSTGRTSYRTCLTRAVSSWTRLYTDLSSRMSRAIFDLADVRRHAACNERQHLRIGHVDAVGLDLLAQDRDARLEVGRLDVGDQPPLEPAAQSRFERGDVARRPVARHHDLRAGLVER